jgi:DNA-binding transcriptional LysR family regulator
MNTRQIRLFLLVADTKSFSKAAELEALTQPAVTQQINRLERETGAVLFRRKHKKIELTKKGRLFHRFAKNMLTMTENLERELKRIDVEDEGILKIGSSHIPASEIIYQSIVDFKKRYPGTYVIYELNDTENISDMVENELLDIGFIGAVTHNQLNFESFSGDELRLVAHRDFDIPHRISIEHLKDIPLILNQKESGVRKFLLQKLEESKISVSDLNIISEIGLPEALIRFVRLGMGCAFIPSILLDREVQVNDLKVIDISDFSPRRNYYMVTKRGIQIPALAVNFKELFLSSVKNRKGSSL